MSGLEIMKIIRHSEETKDIPVIAVTAMAMKEDREKFLEMSCDDYVSKPIDQKILLNVMKKWLGR